MKQGWEIKKLGEVCEIQGGSTPKRTESSFWDNGTYPWFTIEDIREQGHIISDTKQKITKIAWDKMRIFPKDTILLCCTASLGEYAITQIPLSSNQQFNGLTIKDKNYLSPMYLMHYCSTLKNTLLSLSGKATIDFVSADKVRQIPIPIPPREEQERIVEELDCLSGIIEKKKLQLKELDALAESIFYTMFGDPITNEKGWKGKKLGDTFDISSGGTPDTKNPSYWENGDISWIGSNMCQNEIIHHNDGKYITSQGLANSSAKEYKKGYVLVALVGATIGKVALLRFSTSTNQNIAGINVPANTSYTSEYVFYLIRNLYDLFRGIGGDKFKMANLTFVRSLPLPTPPFSLQQEFADKIEAIEKQKELIKQSIKETEELFNSRMNYYFN